MVAGRSGALGVLALVLYEAVKGLSNSGELRILLWTYTFYPSALDGPAADSEGSHPRDRIVGVDIWASWWWALRGTRPGTDRCGFWSSALPGAAGFIGTLAPAKFMREILR
jgi:hypothetical protein